MRSVNREFAALIHRISPCVRFIGERRGKLSVKIVCALLSVCRGMCAITKRVCFSHRPVFI